MQRHVQYLASELNLIICTVGTCMIAELKILDSNHAQQVRAFLATKMYGRRRGSRGVEFHDLRFLSRHAL